MDLTDDEVKSLLRFFNSCGPISYEFDADIHTLYKRLDEHINGPRFFQPLRKKSDGLRNQCEDKQ